MCQEKREGEREKLGEGRRWRERESERTEKIEKLQILPKPSIKIRSLTANQGRGLME